MWDSAIKNCLTEEFKKLRLEANWYGNPPNQFGVYITLYYDYNLISSTYVNLFDENIQK